ncbi:MAG: family 78 glycoside hydrolase catalytic domain, partial [Bryobacteraceae bacterium]
VAAIVLSLALPSSAQQAPSGLRTEYLTDPMGVDVKQPRFSWVLHHDGRGQKQSAYQVLASTSQDVKAGEQWDSGRVESKESTQVAYAGKPLESGRTYYWKVRWWDGAGKASGYSSVAKFDTGLLDAADWKAKWVGGANQLRKEFTLAARPVRARAYICGLGYYELRINGKKVGDHALDPAWTTYGKRALYVTYDVTPYLEKGANAVGVMLGQGWYGSRALLVQLNVEMEGGRTVELVSDTTWKAQQGPITADSVYHGETYDARLETRGWDKAGYADGDWKAASAVEGPKGQLSAQMMPPIRVTDAILPLKMTSPKPGMYVFDMGQNFSGWVELRVQGPRGTAVKLRHAELIYDDGTINVENLRAAKATDVYVLRGDGEEEVYQPRFTYHGFRYVEVTGFPGTPKFDSVRGRVVRSAVQPTGGFTASKQILNEVQRLILWGTQTNLHSVPTDCSQRDERKGWMGDAHLYGDTVMLNFDAAAFYANFIRGMRDAQGADGAVPDTVPFSGGRRNGDPAWGSAYPILVWAMYEQYGDRRIVEEQYAGIKAWADYLKSHAPDGIVDYYHYGDWVPVERTPGLLTATFYYYWSADIVSRAAEALGNKADADAYRKLAESIKDAFNRKFYNADLRGYGNNSQTSNVLPLYLDMASKEMARPALGSLFHDIVYKNDTHLTTGILGTKYVFPLLTRLGYSDLAYELATQTTYPSWGYMVANGATTLWELWQNKTGPSMNSHNHPMYGGLGTWFYNALAGINADIARPGYERVRFEPQAVRDLQWAAGSIETQRGAVASSWSRTPDCIRVEVTIPVGSDAEVHVPKIGLTDVMVRESGKTVWAKKAFQRGAAGVKSAKETKDAVIFEAGSGHYVFELSAE